MVQEKRKEEGFTAFTRIQCFGNSRCASLTSVRPWPHILFMDAFANVQKSAAITKCALAFQDMKRENPLRSGRMTICRWGIQPEKV